MSEQDIDDLIATADGDTTWGDDLRGAISTLAATRPNITSALGTRHTGTRNPKLALGPFATYATTAAIGPGAGMLGFTYMRSGTPTTVEVNVVAALTTGQFYYVLYDWDASGLPTTVAAQWGPFAGTGTGVVQLTSQSQAITQGFYWAGVYVRADATGTITFTGATSALSPAGGTVGQLNRGQLAIGNQAGNTPPNLTTFTVDATTTASRLACESTTFPVMLGFS